ncbi:MAG: hydrolase TatD [Clostridiales bacterium]|nr:hydrolase TatD [Clostridiales bacterium]
MIIDGHLHLPAKNIQNEMLDVMADNNLYGLMSAGNPAEWKHLQKLASTCKNIIPTYGLHPWYADQYSLDEISPYLKGLICLGEIGMDSVWCQVDLKKQYDVFLGQLDIAEEKQCPVILHTKGQEKEIANIIKDYTMPILVHWYSCDEFLSMYLEKGCYFTIGPDVKTNQAVKQVAKEAPISHLLVESDGLSALEWVYGEKIEVEELPSYLIETMNVIGQIKGLSFKQVKEQMVKNLASYLARRI